MIQDSSAMASEVKESLSASLGLPVTFVIDPTFGNAERARHWATRGELMAAVEGGMLNVAAALPVLAGYVAKGRATEAWVFVTQLPGAAVEALTTPGDPMRMAALLGAAEALAAFDWLNGAMLGKENDAGVRGRRRLAVVCSAQDGVFGATGVMGERLGERAQQLDLGMGPRNLREENRCFRAGCKNGKGGVFKGKVMQCSRCKAATYCSSACQRQAWAAHRSACQPPGKAALSKERIAQLSV